MKKKELESQGILACFCCEKSIYELTPFEDGALLHWRYRPFCLGPEEIPVDKSLECIDCYVLSDREFCAKRERDCLGILDEKCCHLMNLFREEENEKNGH
jgi:hypothetical protein